MSEPIISVEHVYKSVTDSTGTLDILRDIDFALAPRETAAIVGASGSGKSTLLSIVAGLDTPTRGTVRLAGRDLFSRVVAFSPGFVADVVRRGSPRLFVSHGARDTILPIETCGRRIARDFRGLGYDVRFLEFDGGHEVPPDVAEAAIDWLVTPV